MDPVRSEKKGTIQSEMVDYCQCGQCGIVTLGAQGCRCWELRIHHMLIGPFHRRRYHSGKSMARGQKPGHIGSK